MIDHSLRDPISDPQTGDVVMVEDHVKQRRRFVVQRGQKYVVYQTKILGARLTCSLSAWREWCKAMNASVEALGAGGADEDG